MPRLHHITLLVMAEGVGGGRVWGIKSMKKMPGNYLARAGWHPNHVDWLIRYVDNQFNQSTAAQQTIYFSKSTIRDAENHLFQDVLTSIEIPTYTSELWTVRSGVVFGGIGQSQGYF